MGPRNHIDATKVRKVNGFSLIEITVAIALFAVLSLGVIGVLNSTTTLTADLAYYQQENLQKQSMLEYFRRGFMSLEGGVGMAFGANEGRGREGTSIRFLRGGDSFDLFPSSSEEEDLVIEARSDARGALALVLWKEPSNRLARMPLINQPMVSATRENPLVLLKGLGSFSWRFYDADVEEWEDDLPRGRRPRLVELRMAMVGEEEERHVFMVPPMVAHAQALRQNGGQGVPEGERENGTQEQQGDDQEGEVNPRTGERRRSVLPGGTNPALEGGAR